MENKQQSNISSEEAAIQGQHKPEFTVNTDIVKLPSQGIFYENKKSEVMIEYLTANDENILTASNLMREGRTFDVLLGNKIKDKDMDFNDLLMGDVNRILLNLRTTGYGYDFDVKVTCPYTEKEFKATVELDKLEGDHILSLNVIYSLILRLRGVFLIKCLKNNKVFSNKLFKKWITKHISDYEFKQVYSIYRVLRDNKKVDIKVEIRIAEILLDLLKIENDK